MRVQIGTQPCTGVTGTHLRLLQHGVVLTEDGKTEHLDFPMEQIARESQSLLRAATQGLADDTLLAHSASGLHFELFFNLAKVSLTLKDRAVRQASLLDGLALWQRGSSRLRDLRVDAHHALLQGYGLTNRQRPTPPPPIAPRWVFLWGRPAQNRSMALLRQECAERGDPVQDLGMNVRILTRQIRSTRVPAPWDVGGLEVWGVRRMSIGDALRRAAVLARSIRSWAWSWKGLDLDERSLVRSVIYDVILGDSLEHLLLRLRPEALVCSMAWGMAYQAAYRAGVRCVEFLHGSVEEGLTQPMVPRPREIVGASAEDLRWLEARSGQAYRPLSVTDPAIELAQARRSTRRREGAMRVAYFPTYTAAVFGGAHKTREDEDAVVRTMVDATPELSWQIKPHPSDLEAATRFSWARASGNVSLVAVDADAIALLTEVDAAVHCGSSLSRPIGQLGIPQLEIVLDGHVLSTSVPPGTTAITTADAGVSVLRGLTRTVSAWAEPAPTSLRDRILLTKVTTSG